MSSDPIPQDDAIRRAYLEWLLAEAEREVASGCARIRLAANSWSVFFLERTKNWPPEQQLAALRGQIKWRGQPGLPPVELTAEERSAHARLNWRFHSQDPAVLEMNGRAILKGEFKIDRRALRRAVLDRLMPLVPIRDGGDLKCINHADAFTVFSDITLTGRLYQMIYDQRIVRGVVTHEVGLVSDLNVLRSHSLMSLFGDGATCWQFLTNDMVPAAAEVVVQLCKDFIEAVPGILERAKSL
jgi:hypothetical protein